MSCNQCKSEYYMRVVQYARPLLQPLTPEQAVMDSLHEMTGKRFYRRITPAGAGKRLPWYRVMMELEDHPRRCG